MNKLKSKKQVAIARVEFLHLCLAFVVMMSLLVFIML